MSGILDITAKSDEYYTLPKHVEAIADNMVYWKNMHIWCPFDDENSYFPPILRAHGFTVTATSTDFFTTDPPPGVNAIVSNPPFSCKREIIKRIDDLGLPFILILPFLYLNDGVPLDYGQQIMLFRKRMHFNTPDGEVNKPRTNCFVLSNGLLKENMKIVW